MNPYEVLKAEAFWKPAVAQKNPFHIKGIWDPKFSIESNHKIVTFGSCFAQQISKSLMRRGFNWFNAEPPPFGLSDKSVFYFNYNTFSAQTGNIYTTSLLRQWVEWALNPEKVIGEVWTDSGRFYDPFRPTVEPNGFESEDELRASRLETLKAFSQCVKKSDYFFFTLGLTESWINKAQKYVYPMCPGTIVGTFDASCHQFLNLGFQEVYENLRNAFGLIKDVNPNIKFLITVSPVPLTATMSGRHVLQANLASKSILRAVAEQIFTEDKDIDYFPSYEIIASPPFKGMFYESNQREISAFGVNFVMDYFFKSLHAKFKNVPNVIADSSDLAADQHCEEAFLEAFGGKL